MDRYSYSSSSGRRSESDQRDRYGYSHSHSALQETHYGTSTPHPRGMVSSSSSLHPPYHAGSDHRGDWDGRRSQSQYPNDSYSSYSSPYMATPLTLPPVGSMLPPGHYSPPMSMSTSLGFHQSEHRIEEIPVSDRDYGQYMVEPSTYEQESIAWRPGHVKCRFPGCHSPMVDIKSARAHLACHLNNKKAFKCSCGTKFGRQSEANRHLEDQRPCERCGDPRRKQRGTKTCSRCFTGQ